jgi:hypothetical protein
MAKLPTPEENGRRVLTGFKNLNSRPGDVLQHRNFSSVFTLQGDLIIGLEYAIEKNWVEKTPTGSFRLTDLGFAEM